jgi:outer membrane receptor for ferrienterochelin and colicins
MRSSFAAAGAALVFCIAAPALADTTGLVRGTATFGGKPAAGVAVTLSGEGTTAKTVTDGSGAFVFARVPFGRYTLTAERAATPAFTEPVDVESDAVVNLAIELQLREIGRAQSTLVKGPGSTPVSVNTIGREQIAALPDNQSLDRVIQTLPGIVRFSYNEPVAHGFHGLTYEIDGVPLPQGTASNFSEVVDPRSIDSLEVFTGAFPAEFGGSRQGAVVNILSHRATDLSAPEEGSFTLGAGTYGSAQASLAESARVGGSTRLFLNANSERTNRGIDSPTFDPVHDASNQTNQFLRTITNLDANDSLAFDVSNNVSAFQIPINATANPNDPVVVPPGTDDVQREQDRTLSLVFTNNAKNGEAFTQISPWYRYDRIAYDGDLANDLLGRLDNGDGTFSPLAGLREDRNSQFLGLRAAHFHVFGSNAVKLGIDASREIFSGREQIAYIDAAGMRQNFVDDANQSGALLGAYVQDKWTPTRYLSILGGLRFDRSTGYTSGSQLSPRIEINGQVGPTDVLHAYYGRLYAAPFLEDTRRAAVIVGGANPNPVYDLQPERDSYYEFGIAHTLNERTRATVNFWKRDVTNVLDTTQLANTPIEAVFNNTIGIAKGVEARVESRSRFGDAIAISASLSSSRAGGISGSTFLFPPSTAPGDVTLNPEDHDQTFEAVVELTKRLGADHAFFVSLEPQYGTGYPVQFQNGPGRLPPHLTFDASVGRDPVRGAHPKLGFTATFTNFTNDAYLIKVNNGFNTTQWGEGFRADLRVTAPF